MRKLLFLTTMFACFSLFSQDSKEEKVEWMSFTEAVERNKKEPKKILVDVYTSWCGWCKKMDATTFKNPAIVKYLNEYYYSVKLNAERKDSVFINNHWFINQNPKGKRSPHDLAISLLDGKLTYPSTVFLDEKVNRIHPPISGFLDAETIEPILHFFGDNIHVKGEPNWENFKKNFEGEAKKY